MGYKSGGNNYDERDKLFQKSFDGKPVNRTEIKKGLDELFKGAKQKEEESRCSKGHTWVRDFDRKTKCAYCKILKPVDSTPPAK